MKKIYSKFVLAAIAGVMAAVGVSCTSDDDTSAPVTDAKGFTRISLVVPPPAADEGSRTTLNPTDLIKWSEDDAKKMGLAYAYSLSGYAMKAFTKSASVDFSDNFKSGIFTFNCKSEYATSYPYGYEEYPIASFYKAWYPYTEEPSSILAVSVTVAMNQMQDIAGETTYGAASVPMVSDLLAVTDDSSIADGGKSATIRSKMHILSSIIAYYVYDSSGAYAAEQVKSIGLRSTGESAVAGVTKLASMTEDKIPALTGDVKTADVTLQTPFALDGVTSKAASAPIYLSIIPGEFTGEIVVKTDRAQYTFPFAVAKRFARAEVKEMPLNLSNPKVQRKELGEVQEPSLGITHLKNELNTSGIFGTVTLTLKRNNEATAGFYVRMVPQTSFLRTITREEVLAGSVYRFGAEDNDPAFVLQPDGSVTFTAERTNFFEKYISFGAIPFDGQDNFGALVSASGFNGQTAYDRDLTESDFD